LKKILITGINGFVGRYYLEYLDSLGKQIQVVGIVRNQINTNFKFKNIKIDIEEADLNNRLRIQDILAHHRPYFILHLASDSSVSYSWKYPIDSFLNNTNIFLNLIESVRILNLQSRVLSVGSSEEYGVVDVDSLPLKESAKLNPVSPYAVARVSQELLSKVYVEGYGLDIVMTRSFNHIGPGQREQFVVSSFAKQVAQKKIGIIETITTGDLSIIRDFLDVRDVVKAYHILLEKGNKGEVYNICSGVGSSLEDLLKNMCLVSGLPFEAKTNEAFIRPNDNPIIIGDCSKIRNQTGWAPQISLGTSTSDIVNFWIKKLEANNL
jgi:GDP-4-dehydro-6-deoxy-D-mannose reductase